MATPLDKKVSAFLEPLNEHPAALTRILGTFVHDLGFNIFLGDTKKQNSSSSSSVTIAPPPPQPPQLNSTAKLLLGSSLANPEKHLGILHLKASVSNHLGCCLCTKCPSLFPCRVCTMDFWHIR